MARTAIRYVEEDIFASEHSELEGPCSGQARNCTLRTYLFKRKRAIRVNLPLIGQTQVRPRSLRCL